MSPVHAWYHATNLVSWIKVIKMHSLKLIKVSKYVNGRKLKPIALILLIWICTYSFLSRNENNNTNLLERVSGNQKSKYSLLNIWFYSHGAPMFVVNPPKLVPRPL